MYKNCVCIFAYPYLCPTIFIYNYAGLGKVYRAKTSSLSHYPSINVIKCAKFCKTTCKMNPPKKGHLFFRHPKRTSPEIPPEERIRSIMLAYPKYTPTKVRIEKLWFALNPWKHVKMVTNSIVESNKTTLKQNPSKGYWGLKFLLTCMEGLSWPQLAEQQLRVPGVRRYVCLFLIFYHFYFFTICFFPLPFFGARIFCFFFSCPFFFSFWVGGRGKGGNREFHCIIF